MLISVDFASVFGNVAPVSAFPVAVFGNVSWQAQRFQTPYIAILAQVALAAPERGLELIARCETRRRRQPLLRLQFATCVSRSFVSLPLVKTWRWICMAALRCLRCSSLLLSAGHSYLCLWLKDGCCAVCAGARYVCRQEPRTFSSGLEMNVAALSALQLATMSAGAAYI